MDIGRQNGVDRRTSPGEVPLVSVGGRQLAGNSVEPENCKTRSTAVHSSGPQLPAVDPSYCALDGRSREPTCSSFVNAYVIFHEYALVEIHTFNPRAKQIRP